MNMSSSKQKILDEALKLFSKNGFEATSIEHITDAVGIRKASFYSHFQSKQELLDTLTEEIKERYETYSEETLKTWASTTLDRTAAPQEIAAAVFQSFKRQLEYLISDPFFRMARDFLTIEQFRHPELASIQNKCEYVDALDYLKKLTDQLTENGILAKNAPELMAHELFSLIYVELYHIQKDPACKEHALRIVEKHIHHFFAMYSIS